MIDKVKLLLGISDDTQDNIISFLIESVIDGIKSYCRIDEVPERLNTTVIRMTADLYRREGYGSVDKPQTVQSETQGSRSVTYAANPSNAEDLITDYEKLLKPYINRRGRVPSEVV